MKIDFVSFVDNPDGSANLVMDFDSESLMAFAKIGIIKSLTDEANRIIEENGGDLQTFEPNPEDVNVSSASDNSEYFIEDKFKELAELTGFEIIGSHFFPQGKHAEGIPVKMLRDFAMLIVGVCGDIADDDVERGVPSAAIERFFGV